MKTLKIKKAISAVLFITFLVQNVVWANPDLSDYNAHKSYAREYLAPTSGDFDKNLSEDLPSYMGLAEIGDEFFNRYDSEAERVSPDKIDDFIQSLIVNEVMPRLVKSNFFPASVRVNFDKDSVSLTLDGKIFIKYLVNGKLYLVSLKRVTDDEEKDLLSRDELVFKNIWIRVIDTANRGAEGTETETSNIEDRKVDEEGVGESTDDVTLSSEGDIAVHEGAKKEVLKKHKSGALKPFVEFVSKMIHRTRSWKLAGEYGVNDVIRALWTDSKEASDSRMYASPDMPETMAELNKTPIGQKVAWSIEQNGYNLYVYNVGRRDFAGGVTTHAGIRTGNIHITEEEYNRLKNKGAVYLAARIAHEVVEIDSWRKKAKDLGIEVGKAQAIYNDKWATGIRKWIRDNFLNDHGQEAKRFGQQFHSRGLETEIRIIASSIFSLSEGMDAVDFYNDLFEVTKKFLPNGNLSDVALNPESVDKVLTKSPDTGKDYSYLIGPMLSALRHFSRVEDRNKLSGVLNARAYFEALNGQMVLDKESSKDLAVQNIEQYIYNKIKDFREYIDTVDVIDRGLKDELDKWLSDLGANVAYYSPEWKDKIRDYIAVMRETIFEKSMWLGQYEGDPSDILIAAASPYGAADKSQRSMRSRKPAIRFRDISNPRLAELIRPQAKGFFVIKELDDILRSLYTHGNWYYQYIRRKSASASEEASSASSKSSTSSSHGEKMDYRHISRFKDELLYNGRIEKLVKGLRYYLSDNPSTIFKQTRVSRIYVGSRTGYFDVKDAANDAYPHQLDLVILVDGHAKTEPFEIASESEDMGRYFPELIPEVKRVKVRVIGVEDLRSALKGEVIVSQKLREELERQNIKNITVGTYKAVLEGNIPLHADLKEELRLAFRERSNLQGQMIKIYREYIQVAGSDLVINTSMPEFGKLLSSFEDPYINDLILYLDNQALIIRELSEDISELTLEINVRENSSQANERTREAREKQNAANDALQIKLIQFKQMFKANSVKLADLELQADMAGLAELYREVGEDKTNARYVDAYHKWKAKSDLVESIKRLDGKRRALEAEIAEIKREIHSELLELQRRLKKTEEELNEAERDYELKCKRIEDAQIGRPLATGVIINDRYKVLGILGKGSFGAVYRVHDLQTDREVAIKIMDTTVGAISPEDAKRFFEREIKNLKDFGDEGAPVPSLMDRGIYAGSNYFAMSLEKGLTFSEIIRGLRKGTIRLSFAEKVALMKAIAETMAKFHQIGAIHRDFKPDQLIIPLDEDGTLRVPDPERDPGKFEVFKGKVKIIDLGTAIKGQRKGDDYWDFEDNKEERSGLTRTNVILGTPHYIAPEIVNPSSSNKPGSKVDQYAMGCMFFELLTLQKPIGEGVKDPNVIAGLHVTERPEKARDVVREANEKILANLDGIKAVKREDLENITQDISRRLVTKGLLIATQDKDYFEWSFDMFKNQQQLREKLEEISGLTPEHIDRLVTLAIPLLPRIDGEIEALTDQLLEKAQTIRPSSRVTADELGKWLSHQVDEMIYRPHDELPTKKSWGVMLGQTLEKRWKEVLITTFVVFIGIVASIWMYARNRINKAVKAEAIAEETRMQAQEDVKKATDALADAKTRIDEAEKREKAAATREAEAKKQVEELKKEREAIVGQVANLEEQKGKVSANIADQGALEKKIKEIVSTLEKQQRELENKKKELEQAIAKAEEEKDKALQEVAKTREESEKIKAEFVEVEEKLKKLSSSVAGVFEEAKDQARNLEYNKILATMQRLPWAGIDNEEGLKRYNLGFDEVIKILMDNGSFANAMQVESQRRWRSNILFSKMKAGAAGYIFQSEVNTPMIKRMDGNFAGAITDLRGLMEKSEYNSSNERMDVLRRLLIELLVEQAHSDPTKKTNLTEAENLRELLVNEEMKQLYLADIYLAQGNFKFAAKTYYNYYHYMTKLLKTKLEEKAISEEDAKAMKEQASYGLLMSAVVYLDQTKSYAYQGDVEGAKESLEGVLKAADNWERASIDHAEHKAWIQFIKAETLKTLNRPQEEVNAAYKSAMTLAKANGQKNLLLLIARALGEEVELKDLTGTWTALITGEVPLSFRDTVRQVLGEATGEYEKRLQEEKRKAEEEKRMKKEAEEKAKAQDGAMRGIKTRSDLAVALIKARRQVQGLENRLRFGGDSKAVQSSMLKNISALTAKIDVLTAAKNNWALPAGSHQAPIADTGENAPDHRIVNAVISIAIEEGLVETTNIEGIAVNILGAEGAGNFADLYEAFSEKAKSRLVDVFDRLCEADGIMGIESAHIYGDSFKKLDQIANHAGVEASRIFISRGLLEDGVDLLEQPLVRHEITEMRIHQGEAARLLEYRSWQEVPQEVRREAIRNMRNKIDYNAFAQKAHEATDRAIASTPETQNTLIIETLDTIAYKAQEEGAGIAREEDIQTVAEHKKSGEDEGIILFADEIVDNCAALDLAQLSRMTGEEGHVVDKFVLFAEDVRKARHLERVIKLSNDKAKVTVITKDELAAFYNGKGMAFEMSLVKDLERYCLNQGVFKRAENVLGIVRGPLKDQESIDNLRRELKSSGKRIPVVIFESSTSKGAYSLVQAVAALIKVDRSDSNNLLIILPPVVKQDLQDKVMEYRALVHALQSA